MHSSAVIVLTFPFQSSVDSALSYASSRNSISSNSSLSTSLFSRVKSRTEHISFYKFFQSLDSEDSKKLEKKDKITKGMPVQIMELEDLSNMSSASSSADVSPTSLSPVTADGAAIGSWTENDDPVVARLSFGSDEGLDLGAKEKVKSSSGWSFRLKLPFSGSSSPSPRSD